MGNQKTMTDNVKSGEKMEFTAEEFAGTLYREVWMGGHQAEIAANIANAKLSKLLKVNEIYREALVAIERLDLPEHSKYMWNEQNQIAWEVSEKALKRAEEEMGK